MRGFKNPTMAVCLGCNETKQMALYQKEKGGKYYARSHCVKCWSIERNSYQTQYRKKHEARFKIAGRIKYQKDPEKQRLIRARHYRKWQDIVFNHYGNGCACCGEDEKTFLSIDHVNNDGADHRKEVGIGVVFYRWIAMNDFPKDLQLLCCNCNLGKHRNGGICPHKTNLKYRPLEERYQPSNWIM